MDFLYGIFDLNKDGEVSVGEAAIGMATLLAILDDDEERFDEDKLEDPDDEEEVC